MAQEPEANTAQGPHSPAGARSPEEELFLRRRQVLAAEAARQAGGPAAWEPAGPGVGLSPPPTPRHWSVVWSDLMMTMFILFAVLYIYQLSERQFLQPESTGGVEPAPVAGAGAGDAGGFSPVSGPLAQVYEIGRRVITETELGDFADIELAPDQTVRIVLTGDVLFDSGEVAIRRDARGKLLKVANLLRLNPYVINVVGHTDSVPVHTPRFPSNWELSVLRATAVARFLIREGGLAADRFYVTGHASFRPLVANDSAANRARNRRVEIIVTREMPGASYLPGASDAF